jgi:lipopolysaccharide export system protein LptA
MEISGFRVPEYDEQGGMTSQLFGDHATMGADDTVKIDGVRLEFYRDDEVFLHAESPYCFYDRKEELAHSDAPVQAEMDGVTLTGKGFELKAGERTVHVLDDCRVEISDVMQQADIHPVDDDAALSNSVTVITSKELFLNYEGRTARFVGTVHVDDSQLQLDSQALEIRFGENNEIDWIEAVTDVRILNEGREAYADKAVYDVQTDEFVLEGSPRLVDGENMLMGEKIRFWRASERMICEPQARLVIYPDEETKTELFEKK